MKGDLSKKRCLADNRRYADLINGVVFGGEQKLQPMDLSDLDGHVQVPTGEDGKSRPLYRDLVKKAAFGVNFVVIGLENQEKIHYLMPVRAMGYDFAEYWRQADRRREEEKQAPGITSAEFLSGFRKESRLNPCVTLVLFFGEEWDGSRSLHELLDLEGIPESLRSYINDYAIHVIEVRKLPDLSVFQTDLRQIFGFIRCSEDIERLRELVAGDPAFQELDEAAYAMMAEYGNARELLGIKKYRGKDGKVDMCKGIMGMVEEGREEGRMEGRMVGLTEGISSTILDLLEDLGTVPESLREQIAAISDLEILRKLHKLAARAGSLEEFEKNVHDVQNYFSLN